MDNNNSLQSISKAVQVIKTAILQSQERTTRNANADLIALNYAAVMLLPATANSSTNDFPL